jgi:hypothetical protein
MHAWDGDHRVSRRRCLLRRVESRRLVRGSPENQKAGREGGEPKCLEHRSHHQRCLEGVDEVPRTAARPLPTSEAKEGR